MKGGLKVAYLLAQASTPKNRDKVLSLWSGDTSGYPSPSEADLAYCSILAPHTDDDALLDQAMRQSGLMRDKWDEEHGGLTYGEATINKARQGDSAAGGKAKRPSQATQLVTMATESAAEFFHDAEGETFVSLTVGNHRENWKTGSTQYRNYLAARYYAEHHTTPGSQALKDATNTLAGIARFEGKEYPTFVRIAEHEGAIYIDQGDDEWHVIRVTVSGWSRLPSSESPVKFRRPKGLLSLPVPIRGGSLNDFRALLDPISDDDFILIVGWTVAALRPRGPYPLLDLTGEQGSGKTSRARMVRRTVDPNTVLLRTEPRDERDLAIAATNGLVVGLDNVSRLSPTLSDALCRLSTGGGVGTRTLYENDEETLFDYTRPALVTSIVETITRGDLLDRALTINLPTVERRRTETDLDSAFIVAWPGILGVLLDAASEALRGLGSVHFDDLPRMADFALWVEAAAPVLGWDRGAFLAAYERNRAKANDVAMEAMPVSAVLVSVIERLPSGRWEGTASQLLDILTTNAEPGVISDRGWPKRAHVLSGHLTRLAPNLRKVGIEVETGIRTPGGKQRLIRIAAREMAKESHKHRHKQEVRADPPNPFARPGKAA